MPGTQVEDDAGQDDNLDENERGVIRFEDLAESDVLVYEEAQCTVLELSNITEEEGCALLQCLKRMREHRGYFDASE